MKKLSLVCAAMLILSTIFFARSASVAKADDSKVLQFNTMVGVTRPYTGATNPIRNIPGGGVPWVIEFVNGKLSPNGDVDVLVKGLVIDPNEPVPPAGTNPSPVFKVIVSCLSTAVAGVPVNVSTRNFPADTAGNAHIKDTVSLPQPCIAPIIFVTSGGGSWFAATGL
jgi:hypothetical protein